jgi:hypothetical protein
MLDELEARLAREAPYRPDNTFPWNVLPALLRAARQRDAFEDELSRLRRPDETKTFGIRVTTETWGTIDGGHDLVGSEADIAAVAARWTADAALQPYRCVTYEVLAYDGSDPATPEDVADFLTRESNETARELARLSCD